VSELRQFVKRPNPKIMTVSKDILSVFIVFISLVLIFEAEIRSIGHLETDPVAPIEFLFIPKFKIAYFAMLLPILYVMLARKDRSTYFNYKNNLHRFLIISFLIGTFICIVRGNSFIYFGADLLVFVALLTGLSLGALLPNSLKGIAVSLTLISISATVIATAIVFALPGADFVRFFVRTTHASAFILLGMPIVLTAPSIISAMLLHKRKWIIISWLSAGIFFLVSILIMQTRSQGLIILFEIAIALMTTLIVSPYFKKYSMNKKLSKTTWKVIFIFLISIVYALYVFQDYLELFLLRAGTVSDLVTDGSIGARFEEIPTVYQSMTVIDHIFGMGFGPDLILTDFVGIPYNTMHIGILNVWWRMGVLVFIVVICLFAKLMLKWLKSMRLFISKSSWRKVNNETLATVICAPGVIALFVISWMSGGWAISAMIPLGILWGVHRKIARGYVRDILMQSV